MNAASSDRAQSEIVDRSVMVRRAPDPNFYALVPLGIGDGSCESPVSYLCRLALEHCVSVDDLVNEGLVHYSPTNFRIWRHCSAWMKDGAINVFAKKRTVALRDALVTATGIQAIGQLSLASLDGVIDLAGMSTAPRRHCPLCYQAADFGRLFRPVLWDLKAVNCCPIHAVQLVSSDCGQVADKRRSRWHRVHMPGVCSECGAIAYACKPHSHIEASPTDLWVARQSAMLISAVSSGERFDASSMPERIRKLASLIGDGFPFRAAAICGFNKARLHDWIHGVRPIKYAPLLALCAASGTNAVDVLRGKMQWEEEAEFRYAPHAKRPAVNSLDELREKITSVLAVQPDLSVSSVAARVDCDRSTIMKRLPREAAMLTMRWRSAQRAGTAKRKLEARSMIEAVALKLRAAGKQVTVRNVWLESRVYVGKGSRFEEAFKLEQEEENDQPC
jgi:hypothetical protein